MRYYKDERYPEDFITKEQLREEYDTACSDGEIESGISFDQWLNNCMQSQGGTLERIEVDR